MLPIPTKETNPHIQSNPYKHDRAGDIIPKAKSSKRREIKTVVLDRAGEGRAAKRQIKKS